MKWLKSLANSRFQIRLLLQQPNRFRNLTLLLLALLIATPLIMFVAKVSGQSGGSALLISEFRVRGPNGANDEFIEVYNNSNSAHVVASSVVTDGRKRSFRLSRTHGRPKRNLSDSNSNAHTHTHANTNSVSQSDTM